MGQTKVIRSSPSCDPLSILKRVLDPYIPVNMKIKVLILMFFFFQFSSRWSERLWPQTLWWSSYIIYSQAKHCWGAFFSGVRGSCGPRTAIRYLSNRPSNGREMSSSVFGGTRGHQTVPVQRYEAKVENGCCWAHHVRARLHKVKV